VFANDMIQSEGSGIQVGNTAMSSSASWLPLRVFGLSLRKEALPRAAYYRMAEDTAIKELGRGNAPPVWAAYERYRSAADRSMQAQLPWIEHGIMGSDGGPVKSVMQIFGRSYRPGKRGVASKEVITDLLEDKSIDVMRASINDAAIVKYGLSAKDLQAAKDVRRFYDMLWKDVLLPSKLIDVSSSDFLHHYMPRMRDTAERDLARVLKRELGNRYSSKTVKFLHEMERTGNSLRYMKDPATVMLNYTKSLFTKIHMTEPLAELESVMRQLPNVGQLSMVKGSLEELINMSFGGTHQAIWTFRTVAKQHMADMGVTLSKRDFDRYVQTMVSLNYGSFMGFRPALAARNLTQSFTTTLPIVGPKYLAYGIKFALSGPSAKEEAIMSALETAEKEIAAGLTPSNVIELIQTALAETKSQRINAKIGGLKAGFDKATREALEAGAIRPDRTAAHMGDALYMSRQYDMVASLEGTGVVKKAAVKTLYGLKEAGRIGIVPYSRVDRFNRVVAYGAQKRRILDKWLKYSQDRAKFNQEAGLNFMGEAHKREFHRIRANNGIMEAAKWSGTQMANETQWIYQLGAGPAAFSQGWGRLFGMYGTWPMWYTQHLIRGATRGNAIDRARFWGWTAVVNASFAATATTAGINISRWSPLQSLWYTGGPYVEWGVDARNILGGGMERDISLSKWGLRDTGDGVAFDPRKGHGLDFRDGGQLRMVNEVLSMFTPGYLQASDIYKAREQEGAAYGLDNKIWKALGFKPNPVGRAWPQGATRIKFK